MKLKTTRSIYNFKLVPQIARASRCLLLIICCLAGISTYGQAVFKGKISTEDGSKIELATISIKQDSTFSKKVFSDNTGEFKFESIPAGSYNLQISMVGYTRLDTIVLIAPNGQQSDFILHKNVTELAKVTVQSKKPLFERKIDRLNFNVENNVNLVGMDVLELLDKTPLLDVKDNSIQIIGKKNVDIMINGRIQRLPNDALINKLKSIPSESIVRIEVITNPPADYDASGNSGLINIVTKSTRTLGYTGSVNLNYTRANYNVGRISFDLNYNTKKTFYFLTIGTGLGKSKSIYKSDIYYPENLWSQYNNSDEKSKFVMANFGFEKNLSTKTALGVSYSGSLSHPDKINENRIALVDYTSTFVDSTIVANSLNYKKFNDNSLNVHLTHKYDSTGKKIDIDFDAFSNKYENDNNIANSNYYSNGTLIPNSNYLYLATGDNNSTAYTLNARVEVPKEKYLISYGAKISFIKQENNLLNYLYPNGGSAVKDTANSNEFTNNENVQALFINYETKIKRYELKFGARAEYTQNVAKSATTDFRYKNDYFNIFPTVYVAYTINDNNVIAANYGRRLERPNISLLNPFRIYENPYYYFEGTPNLKAYYSNNFELSYSYKNNLNFILSYSAENNSISYINFLDTANVTQAKAFNFVDSKDFLFNAIYSFQKYKWMTAQIDASLYYSKTTSNSSIIPYNIEGFGGRTRVSSTFFLNKTRSYSAGFIFNYQFPAVSGLYESRAFNTLDLSAKRSFKKDKFNLTLSVRDVFKAQNMIREQTFEGIKRVYFSNNNSRRFSISLRYKFGNSKITKARSYNEGSSEQGRLSP